MSVDYLRRSWATVLLVCGLMANLATIATFAAVLPEVSAAWRLTASEAGWIGGIYFGGYAAAVPFLASVTDRVDGRWIVAAASALGAGASLVFATSADGFWTALVLRFLGGAALAGVHMPGLKLLAERTTGRQRARGSALYSASYSLGAAASFFLAGAVDAVLGWRDVFAVSGAIPLLAVAAVVLLPAPSEIVEPAKSIFDLRPLLRNRVLMAYTLAFAGNIWEVSAVRAWFVAYLTWILGLAHNHLDLPRPAVISGLASLAGFPVSFLVAEWALRRGRGAIVATCAGSVLLLLGLAATAGGASLVVLPLLCLAQIASLADAAALAGGAVAAADPARRGAALAVFAFVGYSAAFVGPVASGLALDAFGGAGSALGWAAAFMMMALGSTAAAYAMRLARNDPQRSPAAAADN